MPGIRVQLNCQCILNFLKLLHNIKNSWASHGLHLATAVCGARLLTAKPSSLLRNLITIQCYDFP